MSHDCDIFDGPGLSRNFEPIRRSQVSSDDHENYSNGCFHEHVASLFSVVGEISHITNKSGER